MEHPLSMIIVSRPGEKPWELPVWGDAEQHQAVLERAGAKVLVVLYPGEVADLDALDGERADEELPVAS